MVLPCRSGQKNAYKRMQNFILVQYPLSIPPFPVFIKPKQVPNSMAPSPEFPVERYKFICKSRARQRKGSWEVFFKYTFGAFGEREQGVKLKVHDRTVELEPGKPETRLLREIRNGSIDIEDEVLISGTIAFEAFHFPNSGMVYSPTLKITEYEHGRKAGSIFGEPYNRPPGSSCSARGSSSMNSRSGGSAWNPWRGRHDQPNDSYQGLKRSMITSESGGLEVEEGQHRRMSKMPKQDDQIGDQIAPRHPVIEIV